MGTSAGTQIFVKFGWRAAAGFSLGLFGMQFVFLLSRGPHCDRYTWFGYQGGLEARKKVVEERVRLREEESTRKDSALNGFVSDENGREKEGHQSVLFDEEKTNQRSSGNVRIEI